MRRITTASLTALVDQLSDRDKAILADLEHTRVRTGAQLQRLHFDPINQDSRARDRRRVLQRLTARSGRRGRGFESRHPDRPVLGPVSAGQREFG